MEWILSRIKGLRVQKDLSQQDMADKLSVDLKTYGNWERGEVDLTFKMLERIAKAMDVDVKYFWDPDQFENKNFQPNEDLSLMIGEKVERYGLRKKSKTMIPLSECEEIVKRLQTEIKKLEDQNWALTRSLNTLFDKYADKLKPIS